MKRARLIVDAVILLGGLMLFGMGMLPSAGAVEALPGGIDWPTFMRQHDMTFDKLPAIRIFPALPSAWQDVEFRDLRTEGAFLVSASRRNGVTEWLRIKSLAGEPCLVLTDIKGEVRAKGGRPFKFEKGAPGTYRIDLKKGEEVFLCSGRADDPGE